MYVLQDSEGYIYPADRCRWQSTFDTDSNQYDISNAQFYNGNQNDGVTLGVPVQLGYIGKSGRFVAITHE